MARQRQALATAQAALFGIDPVLDALVAAHGPPPPPPPPPAPPPLQSLVESIVYQQLNGTAAATIWRRVRDAVGGSVTPHSLLSAGEAPLRAAGCSGAKARSMLDLSDRVARGEVALGRVGALDDEAVVQMLVPVWGIGRWTAQMFLMFTLGRLDVWPIGDYGVRAGFAKAWGLGAHPSEGELAALGEPFAGARSLVAWYCWRAADSAETGRT